MGSYGSQLATYYVLINGTVSLTTDTDPRGHGLPDGREITMAQAQNLRPVKRGGKLSIAMTIQNLEKRRALRDQIRLSSSPTGSTNLA